MFRISMLCDLFSKFKPCGSQVGLHHSPADAQITLRSVKLCLKSDIDCVSALWEETVLQPLTVFYASKKCLYLMFRSVLLQATLGVAH